MEVKRRLVYGVGVNDADYRVQNFTVVDGKNVQTWCCPYYQTWLNMIKRGYSKRRKSLFPTYRDVTVCEEWHSFMNFRKWMIQQDWKGNHLDKDIIVTGNKVYGPEFCAFVDPSLNMFTTDSAAARGEWPIGVSWQERAKKFHSRCSNPFTKKYEHLGYFNCPNQAHQAWKARKHELACQLADLQTDQRVAEALRIRYK